MAVKFLRASAAAFAILTALIILTTATGCIGIGEDAEPVSLSSTEPLQAAATTPASTLPPLDIAVAGMISPKETLVSYRDMLDYISAKMGRPLNLVQRDTYSEINNLVQQEDVEMAFVCTGAYTEGKRNFGMELLVVPQMYGETYYYSYIIVPTDSKAMTLEDLQGKKFAFTDPLSNTGKLAPTYMLAQMNETPDSFFSNYTFTYSHDRSIEAVSEKVVDGAAVDSLIWNYFNAKNPELTSKTRIILKSPPYGMPPVVVPPGLDPALKEKLKSVLLHMHEDEQGRKILAEIRIDRFVEAEDGLYDSVREMENSVGG
ncbi:MAG: phosphate/phosphite/phosphonate ABC transporter substrate-binding protein [Actinobacteria bacterium]|nr:phosphate/phosphite/phosphonate ABC transporter substrate-binding protein [Actinomycetota bacterium]